MHRPGLSRSSTETGQYELWECGAPRLWRGQMYNWRPQETVMRAYVSFTILTLFSSVAFAQQPPAQGAGPAARLFASSADVAAMMAKAKSERKPDQANFVQPIIQLAPYTANLESRVGGVAAPASVHERHAEVVYVIDGRLRRSRDASASTRTPLRATAGC